MKFGLDMNVFVSIVSAILVFGFIFLAVVFPEVTTSSFNIAKTWVTTKFNLWFVIVVNVVFISIIILAVSKYGKVTIGYKGDKPNFSRFSWYAMLFSAGIGIGIFFYGIAEPIFNLNIPDGLDTSSYSPLTTMYLHWGFHPWAVYSLVAIAIGYFSFNKGLPVTIRSLFYPILKDRIYGIYGDIIDTVAVLSVLFGLSTSLGLGARQINAGFNSVFNLPISDSVQVILIVVITFIATLSVVSGISKGIRILSEINIKLSSLLFLFILIIGPTTIIFQDYFFAFYRYSKISMDFHKSSLIFTDVRTCPAIIIEFLPIFINCYWFSSMFIACH